MLEAIISSKTRIKLLLKFFLNVNSSGYLRGLAQEFDESSNGIRLELNRFENSGLLNSYYEGNKKFYKSNTNHPLFTEIHSIVMKYVGLDKVIETIVDRLGNLKKAYVVGDFARGIDSTQIELVLIGELEIDYLNKLAIKAKKVVSREIIYSSYQSESEIDWTLYNVDPLLLWQSDAV